MYNRLQVFGSDGEFLSGWFVGVPKGAHAVFRDDTNNICVASRDRKTAVIFDSKGKVVGRKRISPLFFEAYDQRANKETKDDFGNSYRIEDAFLFPKITKVAPNGERDVLVKDPLGLWLVTVPIPVLPFLVALLVFGKILACKVKRVQGATPDDT
ncbi:MAG: hypothetical protein ACYTEX_11700 [Planctomycetota bacterium]